MNFLEPNIPENNVPSIYRDLIAQLQEAFRGGSFHARIQAEGFDVVSFSTKKSYDLYF
jgi:hypothetical protein